MNDNKDLPVNWQEVVGELANENAALRANLAMIKSQLKLALSPADNGGERGEE